MIDLNSYQKMFAEWQDINFPPHKCTIIHMALGACEEAGEFAHWVLKYDQGIRSVDLDKAKEEAADAFGDTIVFMMQALFRLGVEPESALKKCFDEVLTRVWRTNPNGEGYSQHKE